MWLEGPRKWADFHRHPRRLGRWIEGCRKNLNTTCIFHMTRQLFIIPHSPTPYPAIAQPAKKIVDFAARRLCFMHSLSWCCVIAEEAMWPVVVEATPYAAISARHPLSHPASCCCWWWWCGMRMCYERPDYFYYLFALILPSRVFPFMFSFSFHQMRVCVCGCVCVGVCAWVCVRGYVLACAFVRNE